MVVLGAHAFWGMWWWIKGNLSAISILCDVITPVQKKDAQVICVIRIHYKIQVVKNEREGPTKGMCMRSELRI